MKKLFIVTKNELLRYFISPLAYVYLVSFLILNGVFAFYFGNFFERGQASLMPMFLYQPWLYLLFISGISMRLWAEEFKNKTIVQIMTMPVSLQTLVWGKFFASWIFCSLALFLTFPFVITVNVLGNPDNMVILLSYLASLALAGCMLAISQTMSALTKNQVIALVLSVVANLMFFWSGLEFVLSFFRFFMPDYIIDTIASFSFLTHFISMISGLVELRDILFFVSIIILFNFTTILIVSFKTSGTASWLKSTNKYFYIFAWFMLLFIFMGFNLLANNLTRGTQLDFSQDKLHTLDKNTVYILQNLPEPVTAKLYFSNILEQRNPAMRQMFNRVRSLLIQYKANSNGRFDFKIYHPESLDNVEDRAIADGVQPIPLIDINQSALFGLVLNDTLQNKQVIDFLTPDRIASLEQDLTSKIYQLSNHKKTVAILTALPLNGGSSDDNMVLQPWEIVNRINRFYNVKFIKEPQDFEQRPDVLMIVHPQPMSQEMLEAVKNYSKNYGNILLLLDSAAEATRLYSAVNYPFMPSDLGDLSSFWGIRFYHEYIIADLDNSIMVDATSNYKNNPAYTQDIIQFKLKKENLNPKHIITKNLKSLLFSSAAIVLPVESADIDFVPLLQASSISSLMPNKVVYDGLNPRQVLAYFKADNNPKIIAATVHGKSASNQFNMVVVADTDFIYNDFWAKSEMIMDENHFIDLFDNADFILNSLDYLTNNTDLMNLRGKSATNREFKDIERLRKLNMFEYKLKEEEIFNQIEVVKHQLDEIWNKKNFEERETFTADELAIISSIRKNMDGLRKQLSLVRTKVHKDIENLGIKIKIINIFAIPLFLSLLLILSSISKKRKQVKYNGDFVFNRPLLKLIGFAFSVLFVGIISVYISNQSDIQKYEGKLIFENLKDKINEIENISIKTNENELNFVKNDNIWELSQDKNLPVYQERIRSFLSALLEARFYEKKSDKAQNLALFGLQPIDIPNSPNTRIELRDKDNKLIEAFEVGKYDIDLGRGSKAAYIKFDNMFQVWLAEVDFVDLSANKTDWTYSYIWNLRYGRLESVNDNKDPKTIANVMKVILNTPLIKTTESLEGAQKIYTLKIRAENYNEINIDFYELNDDIWIKYDFIGHINSHHLQFFKKYANGLFFGISKDSLELIRHAQESK
ncbi:MAG: Gldg family protein [Alphaproteobacteria bacterium]|nr:Gldg family protein [Alphaproteobacteria bacterium]